MYGQWLVDWLSIPEICILPCYSLLIPCVLYKILKFCWYDWSSYRWIRLIYIRCNNAWFYLTNGTPISFEPRHDKTNKVSVRPAKNQISLGIHPVFAVRMWKALVLSYPMSTNEDSDQAGRMIRVFAGRTLILLVLSCRGSFHLRF